MEILKLKELLCLLRSQVVTYFKDDSCELRLEYPAETNPMAEYSRQVAAEETEQYEQLPALSEEEALYWSAPDMPVVLAQPQPEDAEEETKEASSS